jgi:hypothetical protein
LLVTGAGVAKRSASSAAACRTPRQWLLDALCACYLRFGKALRPYRLFTGWQRPRRKPLGQLLRLGLPMGFSHFVEISSFTLMALFVAQLGATVVAGHRIVANLAAICYMLPLALGIATLAQVGQAAGARDWQRAESSIGAGLLLAGGLSALLGLLLWRIAGPLTAAYTDDPAVQAVALGLIGYVALYQVFDAVQTIAAHALRGYRITFVPMFVHVVCFWGVGLLGGWWLAFHARQPMGVAGFWLASGSVWYSRPYCSARCCGAPCRRSSSSTPSSRQARGYQTSRQPLTGKRAGLCDASESHSGPRFRLRPQETSLRAVMNLEKIARLASISNISQSEGRICTGRGDSP